MDRRRNSRIFGLALAASSLILLAGASKAFAQSPAQASDAKAPQIAMQGEPAQPRKHVRVIGIYGHDNCSRVEVIRSPNNAGGEARCTKRF